MNVCGLHILQHRGDGGGHSRMKCGCSGYERLLELTICPEEDAPSEKEQELVFHNDDGSCQVVVVERNLRASDLCQLLALKNRVAKDVSWTIVEQWVDLGLERSLEDHEEVLAVYDMEANGKHTEKRFVFRKDFLKYEFFHSPQQFFPADMVDPSTCDQLLEPHTLQMVVTATDECPVIGSQMWVREANKQVWSKVFLLLRDRTLYICHKVQLVSKLMRKPTIKLVPVVSYSGQSDHLNSGHLDQGIGSISEGRASVEGCSVKSVSTEVCGQTSPGIESAVH